MTGRIMWSSMVWPAYATVLNAPFITPSWLVTFASVKAALDSSLVADRFARAR